MRDLEHDCKVAAKKPSIQNEFQRLRLNRWTSQVTRWLDMGEWDKCRRDYTEADLLGGMCYAGVDLSTTIDLTAVTLAFPREDGVWLWPYIFLPVDRIDFATDRDNVPYDRWVREGHIIPTPGEVVDQESVVRVLSEAATKFRLQIVCFDPWRAQYVANELDRQGIQTIGIPQNYPGMSPPSVELERLIVSGRLRHPGNPCLTMAADNVEVMTGPGGVIKPMKPRQQGGTQRRIDPIVAAVMSLYHVAQGHKPEAGSVYEKRGLRFL
jgi:phage terminase large subunit-like protein